MHCKLLQDHRWRDVRRIVTLLVGTWTKVPLPSPLFLLECEPPTKAYRSEYWFKSRWKSLGSLLNFYKLNSGEKSTSPGLVLEIEQLSSNWTLSVLYGSRMWLLCDQQVPDTMSALYSVSWELQGKRTIAPQSWVFSELFTKNSKTNSSDKS